MPALSLFPARASIGRVVLPDGTAHDVIMTPEFARALSGLTDRVGGADGGGFEDLATLAVIAQQVAPVLPPPDDSPAPLADPTAALATMAQRIVDLEAQLVGLAEIAGGQIAALRQQVEESMFQVAAPQPAYIRWDRPGQIGGRTPNSGTFTQLTATGAVDLSGAGAGQVKFPAAQNASADPNTLDDYEEGTFTPTITGTTAAGAGTYSLRTGSYVKVGRLVSFNLVLAWSAHTGTGNLTITGFPFASAANAPPCMITAYDLGFTGQLAAYVNGTTASLWQLVGGGAFTAVPMDATCTELRLSGHFFV